jgi:hypothetical protein
MIQISHPRVIILFLKLISSNRINPIVKEPNKLLHCIDSKVLLLTEIHNSGRFRVYTTTDCVRDKDIAQAVRR